MEAEVGVGEGEAAKRAESYPRDLLRRLSGISSLDEHPEAGGGDSDEIELSLGLSLNGSFGVDPKGTKLVRSSSIASLTMLPRDMEFPVTTTLARTCSLPAGNEEEHRKRKELQSLKRLEAKRKRSEKRNLPVMLKEVKLEIELGGSSGFHGSAQIGRPVNGVSPPGLPVWAAHRPLDVPGCLPQGSLGSQGSSSSSVSEFESRPKQGFDLSGFNSCTEAKSPAMVQSLPERASYKTTAAPLISMVGRAGGGEERALRRNSAGEMERNMMEEMPCVSTKGEGPNGRRIEGFLYRYKKGEELRIVCVCHGSFLTPAEFVKHAGGGDVAYPLKHIVVNPTPAAFL